MDMCKQNSLLEAADSREEGAHDVYAPHRLGRLGPPLLQRHAPHPHHIDPIHRAVHAVKPRGVDDDVSVDDLAFGDWASFGDGGNAAGVGDESDVVPVEARPACQQTQRDQTKASEEADVLVLRKDHLTTTSQHFTWVQQKQRKAFQALVS